MPITNPAPRPAPEPARVDIPDQVVEAEPDLAQTEADNYARAHGIPSPIKEE